MEVYASFRVHEDIYTERHNSLSTGIGIDIATNIIKSFKYLYEMK